METQTIYPRVFCKVSKRNINRALGEYQDHEHFTKMWLELPFRISHSGDPTTIHQWIGEEFNWTFMAYGNMIPCHTQDHVDALLEEV